MKQSWQFAEIFIIWVVASSAFGGETHLPRCGLLIDPQMRQSPALALFEESFSHDPGIIAIDRSEIDKVLLEQELQGMFSSDAIGKRTAFGKIVKADLLVLIHRRETAPDKSVNPHAPKATPLMDMLVCETHRGLRLVFETLTVTDAPATDASWMTAILHRALGRACQARGTIVAVPPFVSLDLTRDFDFLKEAYPRLIQQELLTQPDVLVAELGEAKALSDEIALAGGEVRREMPLYLTGQYRHDGLGADARVTLTMELAQGGQKIDRANFQKILPGAVPAAMRSGALRLLKAVGNGGAAANVDVGLEAKELADQAMGFARVADWNEARILAEASLLLDPKNAKMHGLAYSSLSALAMQAGGGPGWVMDNKDFPKALGYFHEAVAHLEPYIVGTEFKSATSTPQDGSDFWPTIRFELQEKSDPPMQRWIDADRETRDALWSALHRKSEAQVDDATAEQFFPFVCPPPDLRSWYLFPAESERFARQTREIRLSLLKEFSYRHNAREFFRLMLTGCPIESTDPEWKAFLDAVLKIPNPEIKQVCDDLRSELGRNQAEAKQAAINSTRPAVVTDAEAEITFEKLEFQSSGFAATKIANLMIGCMPAGEGVDLFWTQNLIFPMKKKGVLDEPSFGGVPPWPKDGSESDLSDIGSVQMWLTPNGGCFDGKFAWFVIGIGPGKAPANDQWNRSPTGNLVNHALIALDIKQHKTYWFGRKQGLPPGAHVITALGQGKVCVGGELPKVGGDYGRAWCAVASIDSEVKEEASVKVIFEARELPHQNGRPTDGSSADNIAIAWPIVSLQALIPDDHTKAEAADSSKHNLPRVLVARLGQQYFLLDPSSGKTDKAPRPLAVTDMAKVHADTIYWFGRSQELGSNAMVRTSGPELITDAQAWKIPQTTEFFVDDQNVGHLLDLTNGHWLVSRKGLPPFRVLRGESVQEAAAFGHVYPSNHYGLLILQDRRDVLQVHFPKPLPEAQAEN